ncbi:EAL domain-containing protein, partial [Acinetobacter baumannii]
CFFDQGMDHDAQDAIELQRDLRRAIETNTGLELHYQPKIDSRSGALSGVEALLRWHHPERGMVSPAVFVPVAERFGLIGALGQWVTDEA